MVGRGEGVFVWGGGVYDGVIVVRVSVVDRGVRVYMLIVVVDNDGECDVIDVEIV